MVYSEGLMYTSGLLSISFWVLMFGCFWGGVVMGGG